MKMTKHPGKQNYKARGKTKWQSTYYLWYLPKKRPLYLWVSRGKEPFYHVKRTMCNRNYINLTHYTINLFRTWNPTPLHRSSNLFQSNFVNYILCSYEKTFRKDSQNPAPALSWNSRLPLLFSAPIPAEYHHIFLSGLLSVRSVFDLVKGQLLGNLPRFFYFFYKLFIATGIFRR